MVLWDSYLFSTMNLRVLITKQHNVISTTIIAGIRVHGQSKKNNILEQTCVFQYYCIPVVLLSVWIGFILQAVILFQSVTFFLFSALKHRIAYNRLHNKVNCTKINFKDLEKGQEQEQEQTREQSNNIPEHKDPPRSIRKGRRGIIKQ